MVAFFGDLRAPMRVGELIEILARHPSYADVSVWVGEADVEIADIARETSTHGPLVTITLDELEGYEYAPKDPSDEMLAAALEKCHVPAALARAVWAAMFEQIDEE